MYSLAIPTSTLTARLSDTAAALPDASSVPTPTNVDRTDIVLAAKCPAIQTFHEGRRII